MSDDVFYHMSMIMNVDQAEIAKIVHSYIERGISCDYDRLNCPKPPIYIGPVKVKSLKERLNEAYYQKEDNEMKATSVQNIKNVKDICFDVSNDPIERESKLTIVASTDDDIFAFEFEGLDILQCCKRAGLFVGWEKDQKIRELEKENKKLETKSKDISDDNALLLETNKKLKEQIKKLEALKTPTIENFEEPSSRADILDLAKKCVCGHREQDYGSPESNFQLIADLWNQYLFKEPGAKEIFGIGPMDVAMLMALMKIARIRNGGGSGDSFVDLAGYAACGGEIWEGQKHQKDQN